MINLDFADVKAIMKNAGPAWMSIGIGSGKDRAANAAREALASPLLEVSISGARGVLFNVVASSSLSLFEVNQAAEVIKEAVSPEANIIFGVAQDNAMENAVRITLIATGFAAKLGVTDLDETDQTDILKNMKSEDELDVPSFMRHPLFNRRRQVTNETLRPANTPTHTPIR